MHTSLIFIIDIPTIDTTPPMITIDSPTATTYATGTITVEFSSDDAVHYWYSIDDGPNQTWTASVDEPLTDGTYVLHAYGNDSVGNIGYTNVTFTIEIPTTTTPTTTPPTTPATTPTTTPTTTVIPGIGSFPGIFSVLLILSTFVVFTRRRKKT